MSVLYFVFLVRWSANCQKTRTYTKRDLQTQKNTVTRDQNMKKKSTCMEKRPISTTRGNSNECAVLCLCRCDVVRTVKRDMRIRKETCKHEITLSKETDVYEKETYTHDIGKRNECVVSCFYRRDWVRAVERDIHIRKETYPHDIGKSNECVVSCFCRCDWVRAVKRDIHIRKETCKHEITLSQETYMHENKIDVRYEKETYKSKETYIYEKRRVNTRLHCHKRPTCMKTRLM